MSTKSFEGSIAAGMAAPVTGRAWGTYLLWVPAAALLGFAIAEVFAGLLHLTRSLFLIPYVAVVGMFFYAFLRWSGLSLTELLGYNWVWGIVGAVLVGAFVVRNIFSQPASARAEGLDVGVLEGRPDDVDALPCAPAAQPRLQHQHDLVERARALVVRRHQEEDVLALSEMPVVVTHGRAVRGGGRPRRGGPDALHPRGDEALQRVQVGAQRRDPRRPGQQRRACRVRPGAVRTRAGLD